MSPIKQYSNQMSTTKTTTGVKFGSMAEIEQYAQSQSKLLVVYDTHVLDVSDFVSHHPGGAHLITKYSSKDITEGMAGHFPLTLELATTMSIGSLDKEIKQYLDRDKGLLDQIWNIDHETYLKIVHMPHWVFQLSPKMFDNPFLNKLSFCSWYNIFYVPYAILLYYYFSRVQYQWHPISIPTLLMYFLLGLFFFSFIQYTLHRFVFHSEKKLYDFRVMRYMHFMMHGIHHMFPFDPFRLVLPPIFTAFIIMLGYFSVYKFMHLNDAVHDLVFWTGFLTGYVLYDMIHYLIHHLELSSKSSNYAIVNFVKHEVFGKIKRHHNQHHYSGEDAGYGVSSPLWDVVFRTGFKTKRS